MRPTRTVLALLASFLAAAALSAQPHLVRDLDLSPAPRGMSVGYPQPFGTDQVFFWGSDARNGLEPWVSDGTSAGTHLLLDIAPGLPGHFLTPSLAAGSTVYFYKDDETSRSHIWRTDGTFAGTVRVTRLPSPLFTGEMAHAGSTLFVAAEDPVVGTELFRADPASPTGLTLVRDLVPGPAGSGPGGFVPLGGRVVFVVSPPSGTNELWVSDGSEAGTFRLGSASEGPQDPEWLTAGDGFVYFRGFDPAHGAELWRTNGTQAGTARVADIVAGPAGSSPEWIGAAGATVFFVALTPATGYELWKSDGTAAGTVLVTDSTPGPSGTDIRELHTAGARAFYIEDSSVRRMWASDGTAAGTLPVTGPQVTNFSFEAGFEAFAGRLYFVAHEAATGDELWRSDGTVAGTARVADLNPGADSGVEYLKAGATSLYLVGASPAGGGLFKSDGTAAGTQLVHLPAPSTASFSPLPLGEAGQKLVFQRQADGPQALWASDGTSPGTAALAPACQPCVDMPRAARVGDRLFFAARDSAHGDEPWMTDGTPAGTTLVTDLTPGPAYSNPYAMTPVRDLAFFLRIDASSPPQLGVIDAAAPDPEATVISDHPGLGVSWKGRYFYPRTEDGVERLWASDGTAAGTTPVVEVPAVHVLEPAAATLFFTAQPGGSGNEIWKTDGTPRGTGRVRDLCAVPSCSGVEWVPLADPMVAIGDTVFFFADDGASGVELWKSDGTAAGTVRVRDIRPGAASCDPYGIVESGGLAYFFADDGTSGRELWRSDGSEAGTFRVLDIEPGPDSGIGLLHRQLMAAGGRVYFPAHTFASGLELWSSDGTAAGTAQVAEIVPGVGGSLPTPLLRAGTHLYFSADDGTTGLELWALDLGPLVTVGDAVVVEGDGSSAVAAFEVRITGELSGPATVSYATVAGTATSGVDFMPLTGVLTFVPGGPATRTIAVPIVGDQARERDESFRVQLTAPVGLTIDRGRGDGVILDDDAVRLACADASVTEGQAGTTPMTFEIALVTDDGGASQVETAVAYRTRAVSTWEGADFEGVGGTLTFPAGSPNGATRTVTVPIVGDTVDEPDEVVALDLRFPSGPVVLSPRGLIADDDGSDSGVLQGLQHGSVVRGDLASSSPAGPADWYALGVDRSGASYEIVADEVSGSLGPLQLDRIGWDDVTVLTSSVPVGSGSARALRWIEPANPTTMKIRVRSGGCSSTCAPSDTYRLRARETTYRIARFNGLGDQRTVVVVQNLTDRPVQAVLQFWWADIGATLSPISLAPHGLQLVPAPALAGHVIVVHDGGYGALAGKAVQTDVVTGATYDTPMEPRGR